ncbi:MAG: hypothetical protein KKB25_00185 [Nanoarchaeota archaeon]|nr:hypothetical protein [Nanoarchaeota archaeon]
MPTKIYSVFFDGYEGKEKYIVNLDDKSKFAFVPYSLLDNIAAAAIENAKKKIIDKNKGSLEVEIEDFSSPSTMHREEIFIPAKKEYEFKAKTTLTMNDSYSFYQEISLRNKKKRIGVDCNVLLGQYGAEDKYFVQELKKVFGERENISAGINTQTFCRSDRAISDEEKILVKQHFEDNISQILSTTPQEIAKKSA